ncbi:hypothetical protein AVEN_112206-1 [Araneus ventricosus]|uniref:Uncharacterized protein n=1 Tax=Araneus ventricosus TaxID=182803 RepID=A0A4Y2NPR7_ARAVE|nr:hypothetical protein AVEN_112206-1 [Araneus ventricosus]
MHHSFSNMKRKVNFALYRLGHSRVHLCLSDSNEEAADMGCDHQQMKFSAQWALGKIDYKNAPIPQHLSTEKLKNTSKRKNFFQKKKSFSKGF